MTASHLFLLSAGGSMQQPVAWQTSKWAERWAENKALFREEVMQMMLDKLLLQLQLEVVRRAGDGKLCAVCILHHMSAENEKPEEAACRCNKTIWLGLISVTFGMRAACGEGATKPSSAPPLLTVNLLFLGSGGRFIELSWLVFPEPEGLILN